MAVAPVNIVCAWCQRYIHQQPETSVVSHGICGGCAATLRGLPIEDLQNAPDALLDELPFGLIHIRGDGLVMQYNRAESQISGLAPENVVGKNFFREVAPCTSVQAFQGALEAMRKAEESGRRQFQFLFRLAKQETLVTIVLVYDCSRDEGVILVKRASEMSS